jgi:hypothetical protein
MSAAGRNSANLLQIRAKVAFCRQFLPGGRKRLPPGPPDTTASFLNYLKYKDFYPGTEWPDACRLGPVRILN